MRLVSYLFGGLSQQKTLTDEAYSGREMEVQFRLQERFEGYLIESGGVETIVWVSTRDDVSKVLFRAQESKYFCPSD